MIATRRDYQVPELKHGRHGSHHASTTTHGCPRPPALDPRTNSSGQAGARRQRHRRPPRARAQASGCAPTDTATNPAGSQLGPSRRPDPGRSHTGARTLNLLHCGAQGGREIEPSPVWPGATRRETIIAGRGSGKADRSSVPGRLLRREGRRW